MSFLQRFLHDNPQENFRFPAPCIYLYIAKNAADNYVSLTLLNSFD